MEKCPFCNSPLVSAAKFCRNCGKALPDNLIKCIKCGAFLSPDAKFCNKCGAQAPKSCPQCKRSLVLGARFCSKCGASIPSSFWYDANICLKCGATLKPDAKFCTKCGTSREQAKAEDSLNVESSSLDKGLDTSEVDSILKKYGIIEEPSVVSQAREDVSTAAEKKKVVQDSDANSQIMDGSNNPLQETADMESVTHKRFLPLLIIVLLAVSLIALFTYAPWEKKQSVNDFYHDTFAYNEVIDSRDGQKYRAIKIGDRNWIVQNINYSTIQSVCDSCDIYGRLYKYADAVSACPDGYTLPTYIDYKKMLDLSNHIHSWISNVGWHFGSGIDTYGFAAIPGGFLSKDGQTIERRGEMAGYWLSDSSEELALSMKFDKKNSLFNVDAQSKEYGFSVRCVARIDKSEYSLDDLSEVNRLLNNTRVPQIRGVLKLLTAQTKSASAAAYDLMKDQKFTKDIDKVLKDVAGLQTKGKTVLDGQRGEDNGSFYFTDTRDYKSYKIIDIGGNTWMAQNLDYKTKGSFCYNNDENFCEKYGSLYTFEAAQTACPDGWHLASVEDWESLAAATKGRSLKVSVDWDEGGNGKNDTHFSGTPAGFRNSKGEFELLGRRADFWSSSEEDESNGKYWYLSFKNEKLEHNIYSKKGALSVRCVKGPALENDYNG